MAVSQSRSVGTLSTGNSTNSMQFGALPTLGILRLQGNLDEFMWWPTKLTDAQVTAIYNSGSPKDESALLPSMNIRMGESPDTIDGTGVDSASNRINDISGNNYYAVPASGMSNAINIENDVP